MVESFEETPAAGGPTSPGSGGPFALSWIPRTALAVLRGPAEFYESIRGEAGLRRCLVFSVAALSLAGAELWITSLIVGGGAFMALVAVYFLLLGLLTPFMGGMVVWVAGQFLGGKAGYATSIRIAAYSYAVVPIAVGLSLAFGVVGALPVLYGLFVVITGVKVLSAEPPATSTQDGARSGPT